MLRRHRKFLLAVSFLGMAVAVFWDETLSVFSRVSRIAAMHYGIAHPPSSPHDGFASQGKSCPVFGSSGKEVETAVELQELLGKSDIRGEEDVRWPENADSLEILDPDELSFYDGRQNPDSRPVLIGLSGLVFDVSKARRKYGAGGNYAFLAGREATRSIALSSTKKSDISRGTDDFTPESHRMRLIWTQYFLDKYPVVAKLGDSENVEDKALSCGDARIDIVKFPHVKVSNGKVIDVASALWLYGYDGVRYRLSPPRPHLYPVGTTIQR